MGPFHFLLGLGHSSIWLTPLFVGPAGVARDVGVGAHAVCGDADVGRAGF